MGNMLLGRPASAAIEGERAGLQNKLLRQNINQNQATFNAGQVAASQSSDRFSQESQQRSQNLQITSEKLRQLKESGGFKAAGEKLKSDASLLNAVLQLPESQQQNGFMAISKRLQPETLDLFNGQYDPQKAQVLRNSALSFAANTKNLYGKVIEVQDEKGNAMLIQVGDDGDVREVKDKKGSKLKFKDKKGIQFTTAGGDTISIGGGQELRQGLSKPVLKKEQGKVIDAQSTLRNLEVIQSLASPEFFEYLPQAGLKISSFLKKLGKNRSPKEKEFATQYRKLRNEVEQEFNAYRKEITGAAAAIAELKMLRDSFINMDLDHDQFVAAFDQYKNKKLRGLRLSKRLLREGINIGSPSYGDKLDALWLSGQDDDTDSRGDELLNQGMEEEQIIQQLQVEGYQ